MDEVSSGPWRAEYDWEYDWGWEIIDASGKRVALLDPLPNAVFNAAFIAAAPEMLALLREQCDTLGEIGGRPTEWELKARVLLIRIDRKEAPR